MSEDLEEEKLRAEIDKLQAEGIRARRSLFAEPAFWAAVAALLVAGLGYFQAIDMDARYAKRAKAEEELKIIRATLAETRRGAEAAMAELERTKQEIASAQRQMEEIDAARKTADARLSVVQEHTRLQDQRLLVRAERIAGYGDCMERLRDELSRLVASSEEGAREFSLAVLSENDVYLHEKFIGKILRKEDVGRLTGFLAAKVMVPYINRKLGAVSLDCQHHTRT